MVEQAGSIDPTVQDRSRTLEVRLSLDELRPRIFAVFGLIPAIALGSFGAGLQASGSRIPLFSWLWPLWMVVMAMVAALALLSRRIVIANGVLVSSGFLVRTRRVRADEVEGIFVTWVTLPSSINPYVLFIGPGNRCVLLLNQTGWRIEDIEAIGRCLGVPVDVSRRAGIAGQEMAQTFPGSFSRLALNGNAVAWGFLVVATISGIVAALALTRTLHLP
ncbi:MAG: hypothetical protein ACR2MY_01105 [Candidatus Dormibacteria bacterium]